jgi:hypothetical protein
LVDASADTNVLAEFLIELNRFYAELTGGDELVIREGRIPVVPVGAVA